MSSQSFRFGTVGAPTSTPKKPGGSVGAIQRSAELGLFGLELGWVHSVRISEESCLAIKKEADSAGVSLSVHAPYYINLNANADEWPKSRQRLMDAAHYGHLAGATDIIFHPGSYFERPAEEVLPLSISRLTDCVNELLAAGNPVTLRPETMGKSAMLGSFEDTLIMSSKIENVLPCIDFAHLHARMGDGSLNTFEEWAKILTAYGNSLGEDALKKMHIHISGIAYGQKGEKEHLPLFESDLNLKAILSALHAFGCGGRLLCESPLLEEDALKIKDAWIQTIQENPGNVK
jgi:deoxyribonuclease IV